MYMRGGLAAAPAMPPAWRPGLKVVAVPVEIRRRTPGAPALFIVRTPPRGLRGLGASYDQAYNILAQDTLSAVNNGSYASGADFAAAVGGDIAGICKAMPDWSKVNGGDQMCAPDIQQQVAAAAASYDAWLKGQAYVPPPSFANSAAASIGFAAPPGYQKNPYTGQLEQIPGWPNSVSGAPNVANSAVAGTMVAAPPVVYTQQPAASSGGGQVPSARLTNLTRPGQPFQVGDSYVVNVTGPANSQVSVAGTQNGKNLGTTPMGSTDGSGNFSLQGTMDGSTLGNWSESWLVGGNVAGSLNFTVSAKPAASAPPASSANTGTSSSSAPAPSGGGGGSPAPLSTSGGVNQQTPTATGGVSLSDFFSNTFSVGGFNVPVWGAAAVVIGGILLMTRSGK